MEDLFGDVATTISSQVKITFAVNHVHSVPRDSPREGEQQNQQKSVNQHTQQPLDSLLEIQYLFPVTYSQPRDPGNYQQHQISISFQFQPPGSSTKSASASSSHHQTAAPNQLPVFTTRQQHQISISFHLPPPDSSTKPASSFLHQAAALHQF